MKGDQMGILAAYPTPRELPLSNRTRFKSKLLQLTVASEGSPGCALTRLGQDGRELVASQEASSRPPALAFGRRSVGAGRCFENALGHGETQSIGSQVRLPRLDVVLRRAAPAIHVFIEHARVSGRQTRDDEAGVCSIGPSLNAGDDALDRLQLAAPS